MIQKICSLSVKPRLAYIHFLVRGQISRSFALAHVTELRLKKPSTQQQHLFQDGAEKNLKVGRLTALEKTDMLNLLHTSACMCLRYKAGPPLNRPP